MKCQLIASKSSWRKQPHPRSPNQVIGPSACLEPHCACARLDRQVPRPVSAPSNFLRLLHVPAILDPADERTAPSSCTRSRPAHGNAPSIHPSHRWTTTRDAHVVPSPTRQGDNYQASLPCTSLHLTGGKPLGNFAKHHQIVNPGFHQNDPVKGYQTNSWRNESHNQIQITNQLLGRVIMPTGQDHRGDLTGTAASKFCLTWYNIDEPTSEKKQFF